jgi:hypothetical protein
VNIEIDTTGFRSMAADLARFAGHGGNTDLALSGLARAVLRGAMNASPSTKAGSIKARYAALMAEAGSGRYRLSRNAGKAAMQGTARQRAKAAPALDGRDWLIDTRTRKRYLMRGPWGTRPGGRGQGPLIWSDRRWAIYIALLAEREGQLPKLEADMRAALNRRGLQKATWQQIAAALGVEIGAAGYVVKAAGNIPLLGTGQREKAPASTGIVLSNASRVVISPRKPGALAGAALLQRAVDNQRNRFVIEIAKGVFDDVKTRAERYPGVFVAA